MRNWSLWSTDRDSNEAACIVVERRGKESDEDGSVFDGRPVRESLASHKRRERMLGEL